MSDLWRIGNHADLSGDGGLRYAARWHSAGRRIVYLAESPAGALLEVLVRLELDAANLPPAYTLLRVAGPAKSANLPLKVLELAAPPGDAWICDHAVTREIGDAWLKSARGALARVPSAVLPATFNILLNPLHPEARRFRVMEAIRSIIDPRLLHQAPSGPGAMRS